MRWFFPLILIALLLGCGTWAARYGSPARLRPSQRGTANAFLCTWLDEKDTEQALVAQHTVFPHHFVAGTSRLNELGERDLGVLAAHYKEHPGLLNIQRARASAGLYDARVAVVAAFLLEEGVEVGELSISDTGTGGDGMASERVLRVLQRSDEQQGNQGGAATDITLGIGGR